MKLTLKSMVLLGIAVLGYGLYAHQDRVSDFLIRQAWDRSLSLGENIRPWPWMDTYPVAMLSIPRLGKEQVVMAGVSGAVMQYAPGWHEGTKLPGETGVSLILGDNQTQFSYLKKLNIGDEIDLITHDGKIKNYKVEDVQIVDASEIHIDHADDGNTLVLSTKYPYSNWQQGQSLQLVAIAREPASQSHGGLNLAGL